MDNRYNGIRIAIPTNDGKTIFTRMLGMAQKIHIYEYSDRTFRFVEIRNNPYEKTSQHLKTLDVFELIEDCSIIISSRIGKKGIERLEKRGIQLFFKTGEIEKALSEIAERKMENVTIKK